MEDENSYEVRSDIVNRLGSLDDSQLAQHFTEVHPDLHEVAPALGPQIISTAASAVRYLYSQLPSHGNGMTQDTGHMPSKAEQARWLSLYDTLDNPISILEKVKNGSINSKELDAVRTVYPDIYNEISQKTSLELATHKNAGKTLSYARRVSIAKLLGTPLDSTMTQPHLAAIIGSAGSNTAPVTQSAAKGRSRSSGKPSGPEITQINKVNSIYPTNEQALELRRRK